MNTITRKAAREAAETFQRPEGIGKHQWQGVKRYLAAIAQHYPKAYPSQETLAAEMGCSVRSIHAYQKLAKEHGLLQVTPDAGRRGTHASWSKTNLYHIVPPAKLSASIPENVAHEGSFGTTYVVPQSQASPLSSREARPVRAAPARIVSREEPSRQVGKDQPSLPPRTRRRIISSVKAPGTIAPNRAQPAWRRLAEHFAVGWMEMIETTAPDDRLRKVRPLDSLRHCQRYLTAHFLGPQALTPKTPDEIAWMMLSFHSDVYRGHVRIKDGQSAWMAFTGAWGRPAKVRTGSSDTEIQDYFKEHKP